MNQSADKSLREIIQNITITPENLFQDNHSQEADNARVKWNTYRFSSKLTAIDRCGDSRLSATLPDYRSVVIPTIATGGIKKPYAELYENRSIQSVIILAHHDSQKSKSGFFPHGCGGEDAKAQNMHGNRGIERFIGEEVQHADVILQAWRSAADVAEFTKKPVLAASIDHRTLITYPFAVFLDGAKYITTDVPTKYMFEGQYNPREIYKKGIPVLDYIDLPDVFTVYLEAAKKRAHELKQLFPDLYQTQKTQNPPVLVISTDIRPLSLRYPNTFYAPGIAFEIRIPRHKNGEIITVSNGLLQSVLDQSEYPLEHFDALHTVIIETGNIRLSIEIAREFMQRERMSHWKKKNSKNKIIIAGTNAGVLDIIETFH